MLIRENDWWCIFRFQDNTHVITKTIRNRMIIASISLLRSLFTSAFLHRILKTDTIRQNKTNSVKRHFCLLDCNVEIKSWGENVQISYINMEQMEKEYHSVMSMFASSWDGWLLSFEMQNVGLFLTFFRQAVFHEIIPLQQLRAIALSR